MWRRQKNILLFKQWRAGPRNGRPSQISGTTKNLTDNDASFHTRQRHQTS